MKLLTRAGCSDEMSRREKENLAVAYQAACERSEERRVGKEC